MFRWFEQRTETPSPTRRPQEPAGATLLRPSCLYFHPWRWLYLNHAAVLMGLHCDLRILAVQLASQTSSTWLSVRTRETLSRTKAGSSVGDGASRDAVVARLMILSTR